MIYKDNSNASIIKSTMGVERLHTDLNNLNLSDYEENAVVIRRKRLQRLPSSPEMQISEEGTSFTVVGTLPDPHPKKTGVVSMVHPTPNGANIKLRVRLSVHNSYAVVSPDKEITRDMGYVNLRRSSVERIENTNAFQIVPKDCDANVLTFYVSQEKDLVDWLDTLRGNETSNLLRRTRSPHCGTTRRWSAPVGTFMPVIEED